jgi:hypothetical protein
MLVPGAQGQKSVFPDGVQVDHISENTVGHGVRVRGISNGDTPAAGDVGETKTVEVLSNVTTNTSTPTTIASLTLTEGVWSVSTLSYSDNTASQTGHNAYIYVKGVTPTTPPKNVLTQSVPAGSALSICFPAQTVTITSADADKTIVLKQLALTAAGAGRGSISAVRIA